MKKYILCPECKNVKWFGTIDIAEFNMWKGQKLYSCSRGIHAFTHTYLMDLKKRGEITMVNIKDYLKSGNYMKAEDLINESVPKKLKIKAVNPENIKGEQKLVAEFYETNKKLVLNTTNLKAIAKELGNETTKWQNATVNLITIKTDFKGQLVDAIRVESVKK